MTAPGRAHGTYAKFVIERCRCVPCRAANAAYERGRSRRIRHPDVYGPWRPFVDATEVREHLRALSRAGVGQRQVERLSGVGHTAQWKLRTGRVRKCRPATARALLGVTVSGARARGARVSVEETELARRRVDQLVAHGMRKYEIAVHLDPDLSRFVRRGRRPGLQVIRHRQVTRRTFEGIERLYVEFFHSRRTPTPEEQRETARAAVAAQRRRWPRKPAERGEAA